MHQKRARGGFWEIWKSQLVELSPASGEDVWLSLARGGLGKVLHERGCRWKSQHRKIVYVSPYVEEPLNSKVIKSFVPELRSRVFRVSRSCVQFICVIPCTFRISVSWVMVHTLLMMIPRFLGRFHSGFSPQLNFLLLLSVRLSSFAWYFRLTLTSYEHFYDGIHMKLKSSSKKYPPAAMHSLRGGVYPTAEVHSVYSTARTDWTLYIYVCVCVCVCYIVTEWFFYINHFSLIIFYHSVWWGFELFGS